MDQIKLQSESAKMTSADAKRAKAAIAGGGAAASTTVADHSDPAGEAASAAHGENTDAAQAKQAGKRKDEGKIGTGSDQGNLKPPKNNARSEGATTSKAQAKAKVGPAATPAPSKLEQLVTLLRAKGGATLAELQAATGWQVHSVRGAMAGALRKKGFSIASEKPEGGLRRYRIVEAS